MTDIQEGTSAATVARRDIQVTQNLKPPGPLGFMWSCDCGQRGEGYPGSMEAWRDASFHRCDADGMHHALEIALGEERSITKRLCSIAEQLEIRLRLEKEGLSRESAKVEILLKVIQTIVTAE